jgi:PASTA domain
MARYRSCLVAAATVVLSFAVVASAGGAAAQTAALPSLAGTWSVVNTQGTATGNDTYVFKLTAPNTYSISNAEGFTTLDVLVAAGSSGASATSYWCGQPTATPAGCPAGDDLFIVTMNFTLPSSGPPTYTGTIIEYGTASADAPHEQLVQSWTTVGTQTSGTCVVPDLKGDTLAAAETAIKHAWCTLGKVKRVKSKHAKKGHVISQKPAAGSAGPVVSPEVSKGT